MKRKNPLILLTIIAVIAFLLIFISPLLILYYGEEQYFADKYRQNKDAFAIVKKDLFHALELENADELKLTVSYDSDSDRLILLRYPDNDNILLETAHTEAYNLVNESFGDFSWHKAYISENYINLSEEGNNYQFVYCKDKSPETMIYGGSNDRKIRKLGDNWYLISPK